MEKKDNEKDIKAEPRADKHAGQAGEETKKKKEDPTEALKKALEEKEKEAAELKERLLYQQADFENFKKLKAKEKQEVLRYGNETLVKELLPVIDNLERAIEHSSKSEESKGILEGVILTVSGLLKVIEKFGVTRIEAINEKFDPNVHEAIYQEERDDVDPGTVVGELQKGYMMDGRLLRPAMVSVAKRPEKE